MAPLDDAVLVARARSGSRDAAEQLFRRHWTDVWRSAYAVVGRRELADDVAQDAFVRAFRSLDGFDERRPFGPWIRRIAVNRAVDELRRERRLRLVEEGEAARLAALAHEREAEDEMIAAVRRLHVDRRLVVVLRFWLGYSLEQAAEILGLPVGTVASRLSRGLADLRADLEVNRADCA